jgi:hypothetical protein
MRNGCTSPHGVLGSAHGPGPRNATGSGGPKTDPRSIPPLATSVASKRLRALVSPFAHWPPEHGWLVSTRAHGPAGATCHVCVPVPDSGAADAT